MGIFYTKITVKGVKQQNIADFLKQSKRQAYVSPMVNDCTVVFDKESEDDMEILCRLGSELSKVFQCPILAVFVHDGDLFLYWLYKSGELIDEYNSIPDYFEAETEFSLPKGGDAEKLCETIQVPYALANVRNIFERVIKTATDDDWSEEHLIGDEIHDVLTQALNLPPFAVDTGYYSIENDLLPEDLSKDTLIFCA